MICIYSRVLFPKQCRAMSYRCCWASATLLKGARWRCWPFSPWWSVVQQSDIIFAALVQFQPVTRLLVSVTWCIVPPLLGQRSAEWPLEVATWWNRSQRGCTENLQWKLAPWSGLHEEGRLVCKHPQHTLSYSETSTLQSQLWRRMVPVSCLQLKSNGFNGAAVV